MKKNKIFVVLLLALATTLAVSVTPGCGNRSLSVYAETLSNGCIQYNVRESELFDKDNVAPAINDTVAKMQKGDKLFLQSGDYKFKETIILTDTIPIVGTESTLTDCSFVLDGTYTMDGSFDAMIIDGDNINVTLGDFRTANTDYKTEDSLPQGIIIRESNYSNYKFGNITGFSCGIKIAPEELMTGTCYSYISFKNISNCYNGIVFNSGNTRQDTMSSWVNENYIYGGEIINCVNGVYLKKGDVQVDEYNNNSFYGIAFKNIDQDAIVTEFSAFNHYYNPTFENVSGMYVYEKVNSKANKFYFEQNIPDSKLSLRAKGDIAEGNITDDDGEIFATRIVVTNTRGSAVVRNQYEFVNKKTVDAYNTSITPPLNVEQINVDSSESEVRINLSLSFSYNGFSFILNVIDVNKDILIVDGYEYIHLSGKITEPGRYKVIYLNNRFTAIEL